MVQVQQQKSKLTLQAVFGDDGRLLDDADDAGQCFREYWSRTICAREDMTHEVNTADGMHHVVRAPGGIIRTRSEEDFSTMLARKTRNWHRDPDGLRHST